jgi:hypothetical protein
VAARRPGGVTFAGWLIGINGVLLALGAVVLLLVASNTRLMVRHGLAQGPLLGIGFLLLAVGLAELLLVYALFGGSNVARIIATILFGISLLSSLTAVLTRGEGAVVSWITGVIDVIVLVSLWRTPGAQEFFASTRSERRPASPPPPPPPPRL